MIIKCDQYRRINQGVTKLPHVDPTTLTDCGILKDKGTGTKASFIKGVDLISIVCTI